MPAAAPNMANVAAAGRRLVLCFDGTANKFQGNRSDTNIVKIYQMLERNTMDQFHYYQPGIGTYSKGANENAGSLQFLPKTRAYISATLDQMFGISFVDHVLGGYKFVMRYWEPGDDIYIFGFSRGAYTARFLAEMIHGIGLLSRGNEEMVHFAWETFSNFQRSRGNVPQTKKDTDILEYMENFKTTFCKPEIHIHFLGLFDCVNSVGQFEVPLFRKSYRYASTPPAKHIRHAASIHERRLKFKPALCIFENLRDEHTGEHASLKEHWFAGNHGDVGGGWGPEKKQGECLLSDITLKWMVDEMMSFDVKGRGGELKLIEGAEEKCRDDAKQIQIAHDNGTINGPLVGHDMLAYGHGAPFYMTFIWWIIEILPISARLQLEGTEWVPRYFPPNFGGIRDIPENAKIDDSVHEMLKAGILSQDMKPVLGGRSWRQNLRKLLGLSVKDQKHCVHGRNQTSGGA